MTLALPGKDYRFLLNAHANGLKEVLALALLHSPVQLTVVLGLYACGVRNTPFIAAAPEQVNNVSHTAARAPRWNPHGHFHLH